VQHRPYHHLAGNPQAPYNNSMLMSLHAHLPRPRTLHSLLRDLAAQSTLTTTRPLTSVTLLLPHPQQPTLTIDTTRTSLHLPHTCCILPAAPFTQPQPHESRDDGDPVGVVADDAAVGGAVLPPEKGVEDAPAAAAVELGVA
jgi:hypothetical protein